MESKQQQSIIFVGVTLLCITSMVSAQLSYHLDANTNSYTLQTPNSQQSFTRYFNGQPGAVNGIKATRAHPIQAAQSQQQPQQQLFSTSPQQFAYQTDAQEDVSAYYRQQQEYQNQQQQQLQQQELQRKQIEQNNNLYTTYQVPQVQQAQQAEQAQQIQSQSQPDLSAYYQQIQQAQLQQQRQQQQQAAQQQQLANQQQFAYQQQNALHEQNENGASQYQPETQTYKQFEQQAPANNLLGHKYSPSNEVSHVKYTSEGLNYNF